MAVLVVGVDQVEHVAVEGAVEERGIVVGFVDAVARQSRTANARVHVEPEDDVVVVVCGALVRDVVVPEDDVAGLRVGPLEAAYLDTQS